MEIIDKSVKEATQKKFAEEFKGTVPENVLPEALVKSVIATKQD
jgi:hypothetical protein